MVESSLSRRAWEKCRGEFKEMSWHGVVWFSGANPTTCVLCLEMYQG